MVTYDPTFNSHIERMAYRRWFEVLWRPVLIAVATVAVVLLIIVTASLPAWSILGAGRGLVPEQLYPLSGFFLVLGLTIGHTIVWGIGSVAVCYALTLAGYKPAWETARNAMAGVYLLVGPIALLVFHALYGGWLLGMPRVGLEEWLAENHPDARWFLVYAHPAVDFSLIPLAAIFLLVLWKYGDRIERETPLQAVLALTVLGTSLAVVLSLAMHSMLVHTRIGL